MSELPLGWVEASVLDLIDHDGVFSDGDWVETKDQDPSGGVRLIQLADVGDGVFRDRSARFLTTRTAKRLQCTYLEPGDVLVARMPDPLGRACVFPSVGMPAITAVDVCILRPSTTVIDLRWLMWAINSPQVRGQIAALQSGTTRKRISRRNLGTVRLPVSPRSEQSRMVEAIEEQFSRLESAEDALQAVRRRSLLLRRSIAERCTTGEWPVVPLGEVTAEQAYGSSAKAHVDPSGVPILRMGNLQNGAIKFEPLKYLPSDHPDVRKHLLQPGDLLFNRTNSPELVGKSAVYKAGSPRALFASYLIRVRLDPECDPAWAAAVINGPIGRHYISSVRTQQVGQANVNGTKLAALPLPLPPIDEQQRIVAEMDRQLSIADAMETAIDSAAARSAALRRAILDRAFRGTLVPQDPGDEPASILLERIAQKRASDQPKRARKKVAGGARKR